MMMLNYCCCPRPPPRRQCQRRWPVLVLKEKREGENQKSMFSKQNPSPSSPTIDHQSGRVGILVLQRLDAAGVPPTEAGGRIEQPKRPVPGALVRHDEG